jgi:hypothetical protein
VAEHHRSDAAAVDVRMPPGCIAELLGMASGGAAGIGYASAVRPSTTISLDKINDWTHS